MILQACPPSYNLLIMQLFKLEFLEFLSILKLLKDHYSNYFKLFQIIETSLWLYKLMFFTQVSHFFCELCSK